MENVVQKIKNNIYYILGIIIVFLALFVIFILILNKNGNQENAIKIIPTPTTVPIETGVHPTLAGPPINGTGLETSINPSVEEKENRYYLVMNLLEKLPHQGTYFSLDYDYDKGTFILSYAKTNIPLAEENFKAFLNQNQVKDSSWIENIVISYK